MYLNRSVARDSSHSFMPFTNFSFNGNFRKLTKMEDQIHQWNQLQPTTGLTFLCFNDKWNLIVSGNSTISRNSDKLLKSIGPVNLEPEFFGRPVCFLIQWSMTKHPWSLRELNVFIVLIVNAQNWKRRFKYTHSCRLSLKKLGSSRFPRWWPWAKENKTILESTF